MATENSIDFKTLKSIAKKENKRMRKLKGKVVVLNTNGKIYAHCRETRYGLAWRAPTRKRRYKHGLETARITGKTQLKDALKKIS